MKNQELELIQQEINVAIAECLGKIERLSENEYREAMEKWESEPEHPHSSLTKPVRVRRLTEANYAGDMNAMAEARKTLTTKEEQDSYCLWLAKVVSGLVWSDHMNMNVVAWKFADSTAIQQAEAFLRTKGLWK